MASIWDFLDNIPRRGDVSPEDLAARRQGYADLYAGGFLSRNKDEDPMSVRAMQASQDFIPGIGDAIAFGEAGQALSEGDRRAAALLAAGGLLGVVPGAGDALARPIIAAGRKMANAIPSEAIYAGRSLAEGDMRGVLDAFTPSRPAQGVGADVVMPSPGIRAYHGTPHEFPPAIRVLDKDTGKTYVQEMGDPVATGLLAQNPERYQIIEENQMGMFDFSKMGTGEGAQAYGWGGYLAEDEGVAKSYRDALSEVVLVDGENLDDLAADARKVAGLNEYGSYNLTKLKPSSASNESIIAAYIGDYVDPQKAISHMFEDDLPEAAELAFKMMKEGRLKERGSMYEVNINAKPEDFLDWDKPFSEQPKAVQDVMGPRLDAFRQLGAGIGRDPSGAEIHRAAHPTVQIDEVDWSRGIPEQASKFLREAGIPGIKYFDAGSRGVGEGTRNYVVFDENLISIVKKYGIAGAAAMLGASVADVEQAMASGYQQPQQGLLSVGAQ